MDPGEQTTGTRDEDYGLVSVLYHALHGAENCRTYAADAEAAGRAELAAFFREAQDRQVGLAERAKELLGIEGATPAGADRVTTADTTVGTDVPTGGATVRSDVVAGGAMVGSEIPPDAPTEETSLTSGVPGTPSEGAPVDVEGGGSPESSPRTGGVRSRPDDAQREADLREDGVDVSADRPAGDVPSAGEPAEDVAPARAVPPDAPRTEEPPPRTGETPTSPSEPTPGEEPPSEEHLPRQGP